MEDKEKVIKEYPELDEIVKSLTSDTCKRINTMTLNVKSEMPYKAQYVLEKLIQELESRV